MADQLRQNVYTGPRARLEIGGRPVGHMTDVSVDVNLQNMAVEECGDAIATALVTTGVGAFVSCGYVKIVTTDPLKDGFMPAMNTRAITDWPEVNAVLYDTHPTNPVPVGRVVGCVPESFGFRVGARTLAAQNMRWRGRYFKFPSDL